MKTYNIELTAEQLIELNDLLVHDLDIDPCFVTGGIINQVRDITFAATWDIMDTDELWDMYVHTVGADELLQDYRYFVSRTQMIQELTNLRRRG